MIVKPLGEKALERFKRKLETVTMIIQSNELSLFSEILNVNHINIRLSIDDIVKPTTSRLVYDYHTNKVDIASHNNKTQTIDNFKSIISYYLELSDIEFTKKELTDLFNIKYIVRIPKGEARILAMEWCKEKIITVNQMCHVIGNSLYTNHNDIILYYDSIECAVSLTNHNSKIDLKIINGRNKHILNDDIITINQNDVSFTDMSSSQYLSVIPDTYSKNYLNIYKSRLYSSKIHNKNIRDTYMGNLAVLPIRVIITDITSDKLKSDGEHISIIGNSGSTNNIKPTQVSNNNSKSSESIEIMLIDSEDDDILLQASEMISLS